MGFSRGECKTQTRSHHTRPSNSITTMGLVEYSDSESESEVVQSKPVVPATTTAPKKPFQKLLDRSSGSGKIVVNLPAASETTDTSADVEQPPAKRAKTIGGSRFSSLGSFLPPPKKTGAAAQPATVASKKQGTTPAPGIHLKTAAEPAFIRGGGDADTTVDGGADNSSSGMGLPPPKAKVSAGPSIPEGQKPEEEVKLVGKPLMFKPLSVARKKPPVKKKKDLPALPIQAPPTLIAPENNPASGPTTVPTSTVEPPPQKKKISLFSMGDNDDEPPSTAASSNTYTSTYEPLFTSSYTPTHATTYTNASQHEQETSVTASYPTTTSQQQQPQQNTLSILADNLSLTPAARRELFGRNGSPSSASASSLDAMIPPNAKVITFDMEREYAHNETLRAAAAAGGGQQAYNPVRSIAPGKHSLRQVVNMAQSNQSALEESFARQKSGKRDAAGRYGWG